MPEQHNDRKDWTITRMQLATGMIVFGSATPVSKIVTNAMPVFVGSGARVLLGGLALLPFVWRRRKMLRTMSGRDWALTAFIALFGMFGFSALMLYGMRMVSGVVGAIVMSTAPAVTAAASMIFLRDQPTWRKLAAIGLAVAGILVLHLGSAGDTDARRTGSMVIGSLLVFGAVCCEAAYTLLGKRVSENVDPTLIACLAALLATPLFVPLAVWQWSQLDPQAITPSAWIALIWYGVGTLALGTWLWYSGLRKAEGAIAAVFMGLMPASALVLSYLLLGEPFQWIQLFGFSIVLAGVVLISWEHARMARSSR